MGNYYKGTNAIFDMDLTEHEKIVFIYIERCTNNNKIGFPSYETIGKKCSINRRTAIRTIKQLLALNMIKVCKHSGQSNHYKITSDYRTPTSDCESLPLVTVSHPINN
jgi:hypothetical protein